MSITYLTLFSAVAALFFLAVVARSLIEIVVLLEGIGGNGESCLAKLRQGLRAIERETSHLPATAPDINTGLTDINVGLEEFVEHSYCEKWADHPYKTDPLGNPLPPNHPWNTTTIPRPGKQNWKERYA